MAQHTRFDSRFGTFAGDSDPSSPSESDAANRPSKGTLLARLGELIRQAQKMLKAFDERRSAYIGYAAILREQMLQCLVDIGTPAQEELRTIATLDLNAPEGLDEFYRKGIKATQNDPEFHRLQLEHDTITPPKIRQMIELLDRVRDKILGVFPLEPGVENKVNATKKGPAEGAKKRPRRPHEQENLSPSERRAQTTAKLIVELGRLKPRMTGSETDYAKLRTENPGFLTFRIAAKHLDLKEKLLNLQGHTRYIRLAQELAAAHHGRALSTVQTDWKKRKPRKAHNPKR